MIVTKTILNSRTREWNAERIWVNPEHVVYAEPYSGGEVRGLNAANARIQMIAPHGQIYVTDQFQRVADALQYERQARMA